jgi:uncharacterized protein (TIGR00251 family)
MHVSIDVRQSRDGALLPVRAQPGSRRNAVVGVHAGQLKVAISAPPDKGKANDALVRVLAKALGIRRSDISLASGAASRDKVFVIVGLSLNELRRRLEIELTPSNSSHDS